MKTCSILAVFAIVLLLAPCDRQTCAADSAPDTLSTDQDPSSILEMEERGGDSQASRKADPFWSHVPVLPPSPRIGWFLIAPTGPGYYSARDAIRGRNRSSPPKTPYPPTASDPISFFDADYRYLEDPGYTDRDFFDGLKRKHPAGNLMWSMGGEERVRYMHEVNSRFTPKTNIYTLTRSRLYGDFWYCDRFRVYAEMQDSQSTPQALPPVRTDVDQSDLLNLFADAKLGEFRENPAYVRGGRQELYFGSQRLISPSDFPNTRRTFTGIRGFWRSDNWDIDAFWVEPVQILANQFDRPNHRQQFVGLWSNYRPCKGQQVDLYYLMLDDTQSLAVGAGGAHGGFNVHTFGTRYAGDWRQMLWDFEGMYQFGGYVNQTISAAAAVAGLGYRFADVPGTPQVWTYYEWANGDPHPGASGVHRTFNQLFPWGHAYFGYLDLVGRQNIHDVNMQLSCFPVKWLTATLQYHVFRLDSPRDALYNASGAPIRGDPTGAAGRDVGDELDVTANLHLARHHDLFFGYSKLFAGSFIRQTGPGGSPEVTYVSYSFKW